MSDDNMREALQQMFDAFTDPEAGEIDRRLAIKDAHEALAATQARPVDAPTDAERYLWLKANADISFSEHQWFYTSSGQRIHSRHPTRTELDSAVDAAMRATPADGGEG